jgi:hypothetical protein
VGRSDRDLSQIQAAVVVLDDAGKVAASRPGPPRADDWPSGGGLPAAAGRQDRRSALTQPEVATGEGSVFAVRDGKTVIAATTGN